MPTKLAGVAPTPESTLQAVTEALGDKAKRIDLRLGEATVVVAAKDYLEACRILRDAPGCRFEQLIDLCGVDYSDYRAGEWEGPRYAVAVHLLSVSLNQRIRVRVFAPDDDFPVVDSVNGLWNAATRRLPMSLGGQLIVFETLFACAYAYLNEQRLPGPVEALAIVLLTVGVLWAIGLHRAMAALLRHPVTDSKRGNRMLFSVWICSMRSSLNCAAPA